MLNSKKKLLAFLFSSVEKKLYLIRALHQCECSDGGAQIYFLPVSIPRVPTLLLCFTSLDQPPYIFLHCDLPTYILHSC